MMMPSFAVIGPGPVGLAIGRRLREAGYPLQAVIGRSKTGCDRARAFLGQQTRCSQDLSAAKGADLLLLALPDRQIASTAADLHRQQLTTAQSVLIHFSGLHPASILLESAPAGCRALSLHPLMTFPAPQAGYASLPGAPMAIEGDEDARAMGEALARAIGCAPFHLATEAKPLYHAAAVISCNYTAGLAAAGRDLMAQCGVTAEEAWQMLLPLMRQTWDNLTTLPPEEALTGPIARGDIETVRTHLDALPADTLRLYKIMGRQTLQLAKERLPQEVFSQLDKLLS